MKKVLFALTFSLLTGLAFSQTADDYIELARDILKSEKKAAIASEMNLSDAEVTPFWELYNEFNNKLSVTQNQRIAIIKQFAANYESLSDDMADDLIVNYIKYEQDLLKLKKSYYARFKKILPAGKAARYFQLENKIQTLVDAELALDIPLIEVK